MSGVQKSLLALCTTARTRTVTVGWGMRLSLRGGGRLRTILVIVIIIIVLVSCPVFVGAALIASNLVEDQRVNGVSIFFFEVVRQADKFVTLIVC